MKKLYFLLIAFSLVFSANAQHDYYKFSQTNSAYTPLTGAQKISPDMYLMGQNSFGLSLPFNFRVIDKTYNSVFFNTAGEVSFLSPQQQPTHGIFVAPLGAQLANYSGNGGVYGAVYGDTGKRIIKVEFRSLNFEFGHDSNFVNFQAWLYEEDNSIELRYGPSNHIASSVYFKQAPSVGIFDLDFSSQPAVLNKSYYITGSPSAATFLKDNASGTIDSVKTLNGNIPPGTVYRFEYVKNTTSVKQVNASAIDFSVYPNPSAGQPLTVAIANTDKPFSVTLTDITGRTIYTGSDTQIPTDNLRAGMYWINVACDGFTGIQKVVITR